MNCFRLIECSALCASLSLSGTPCTDLNRAAQARLSVDSPNKSYALQWRQGVGHNWSLYLTTRGGRDTEIRVGGAYANPQIVTWALDSNHFELEEHVSNDFQNTLIYRVSELSIIDVGRAVLTVSKRISQYQRLGSHMYVLFDRWRAGDSLGVCVEGHTDSPARPFAERFVFVIVREPGNRELIRFEHSGRPKLHHKR